MAAVAVLDYSLFHHLFGVPETEVFDVPDQLTAESESVDSQIPDI